MASHSGYFGVNIIEAHEQTLFAQPIELALRSIFLDSSLGHRACYEAAYPSMHRGEVKGIDNAVFGSTEG